MSWLNYYYIDDSNFLAEFYRLGIDCFSLHYSHSTDDLPGCCCAKRAGVYDCVHRLSDPDYDFLQHLQLCGVSG